MNMNQQCDECWRETDELYRYLEDTDDIKLCWYCLHGLTFLPPGQPWPQTEHQQPIYLSSINRLISA